MTGIVIAVFFLIAVTRSPKPAPGETSTSSVRSGAQLDGSSASGAVLSASPGSDAAVSNQGGDAYEPASQSARHGLHVTGRGCASAKRGLAWYRGRQRDWLRLRGVPSRSGRKPHGCADARYLASLARERASIARRAYGRWLERRTLRDFPVRPGSNAWPRAVREAQRAFPGTEAWLLSCSASEGGHGRWVPNSDGAPPGGWLQFYESTFWRMWATARVDVLRRGFRVPRSAASWYSPLGQALAGGWGLTNGRRHEWNSSGC